MRIGLIEVIKYIWSKRAFLAKVCGIALVAAIIVAFSIPKEYTTVAMLTPEAQDANKNNNLAGLAAIADINFTATGVDAISPTLYPDVVRSNPFMIELLPINVNQKYGEFSGTLYEYMEQEQKGPWWGYIIRLPFKFLAWVRSLVSSGKEEEGDGTINPFVLTREQENILNGLKGRISVNVNERTMMISVSVKMQDPLISAQVAEVVIKNLQSYIKTYRTQKAKQDLIFTEKIFEEAKQSYYKLQQSYAKFEDANRNISTASYRTEQERLRNEMILSFNVYNSLAQKLEQSRLKVQEQTPVYTVIEPPTVPTKASAPRKSVILLGFVLLALFGAIGWIFLRMPSTYQE